MKEKPNNPLKVGRVNIDVEKALDLQLTSDVSVYFGEEELNALASHFPDRYLAMVEEVGKILKCPDFVATDKEKKHLAYVRFYPQGAEFRKVFLFLEFSGTPAHWWVRRLSGSGKEDLAIFAKEKGFVRPLRKYGAKYLPN